jgi:hypothetical protein
MIDAELKPFLGHSWDTYQLNGVIIKWIVDRT